MSEQTSTKPKYVAPSEAAIAAHKRKVSEAVERDAVANGYSPEDLFFLRYHGADL